MDRSPAATIARSAGRLAAALLPLAALALLHSLPDSLHGNPLPWVAAAFAGSAAVAAGLALLFATLAAVGSGRIRDLADAAGFGMLAVTFGASWFGSVAAHGLGVGLASASVAFAVGSFADERRLTNPAARGAGIVIDLALLEACLGGVLLVGSFPGLAWLAPVLLIGAAAVTALAGIAGFDQPWRATALGMAASSAVVLAIAESKDLEALAGPAGIALAALLGARAMAIGRPEQPAWTKTPDLELPGEREFDELTRLTRELRATIDDLIAARRTIELQRVEIERAETLDPLTGLAARGAIIERLRTETAEARRYHHPVALVLLDIDNLAALNHELGLEVGDAILREVALRLRLRIREADALGRLSGDAFLAILPHSDEGAAAAFAQAVRDRLLERPISTDRGDLTVQVSMGIALMRPAMMLSAEELLAAAEEGLLSAKAAGGSSIAFDRLHGLARIDGHEREPRSSTGEAADHTR